MHIFQHQKENINGICLNTKCLYFGKLIYSLDYTKLIRSLLLNITNGVRVQEALEISRNVVNNEIMVTLIEQAINKVYNGELWVEPFEDAKLRFSYDN